MECGWLRPAIHYDELDEDIFDVGLGVLDEDVEVAILGEDASVHEFEFGLGAVSAPVFSD
jgi:hypothetical protein